MGGENTKESPVQNKEKKEENDKQNKNQKENKNSEESEEDEEEEDEEEEESDEDKEKNKKDKNLLNKNNEVIKKNKIQEDKNNEEKMEENNNIKIKNNNSIKINKSEQNPSNKNNENTKNNKKIKEDDDEEKEEEEEESDEDKEKNKNDKQKNNKITIKNEDINKNIAKNKKKNKKEKYFSVEESLSSNSKSDKKPFIKSNNKQNISELSSYIDERKFNTNTSFNFSIQSKNSKNTNENSLSEENLNHNYPKEDKRYRGKYDNKYYGDFNTLDKDFEYKKKKKKEESVDSEIVTDISLPLKERVINEFKRHKYYLDTNEKGAYSKINKKSFSNPRRYKYRKSVLLHKKEITCLISLSGTIKKIAYASSSKDKTISLWDSYFLIISDIKCNEWYSNYICEFDTTNILSCESNHIKMYDLMSEHYNCVKIFKDHIEDINCLLSVIDLEEEKFIFLSGGKDKTLRLWDHEMDAPIKYYEGHYSTVTHIQKYGNSNKKIISCSEDKTFIVWDIKNTNPLKIYNNYFNHLVIVSDNLGFCCGAYDNKIRFYNEEYLLIKCIVSEFYGIRYILMIDDFCMLIVDINNNMNILDLDEIENNLSFIYTGYEDEVVSVIKSFNWNPLYSGSKAIMVACKNGYVYQYSFEFEPKNNDKYKNQRKKSIK